MGALIKVVSRSKAVPGSLVSVSKAVEISNCASWNCCSDGGHPHWLVSF